MSKKLTPLLAIIGAIVIAVLAVIGFVSLNNPVSDKVANLGGWQDQQIIEDGTTVATSTTALPVKVLDRDADRKYAIFTNPSATALYLYFSGTALAHGVENNPTGTITSLDGIYLAASGGTYELLDNNLIIDEVWVTSTAASLDINVYYK